MDNLPTIYENDIIDYSELNLKMLNEEMDNIVEHLNKQLFVITQRMKTINEAFEKIYLKRYRK